MLKSGDKLVAKWTEKITDHVTKGKAYEVVDVESDSIGFRIINDKGKVCFPVSTAFTKLDREE